MLEAGVRNTETHATCTTHFERSETWHRFSFLCWSFFHLFIFPFLSFLFLCVWTSSFNERNHTPHEGFHIHPFHGGLHVRILCAQSHPSRVGIIGKLDRKLRGLKAGSQALCPVLRVYVLSVPESSSLYLVNLKATEA